MHTLYARLWRFFNRNKVPIRMQCKCVCRTRVFLIARHAPKTYQATIVTAYSVAARTLLLLWPRW